MIRKYHHL